MTKLSSLASVAATRALLETYGLAAKKSLGQNFLVNAGVLEKILSLSELDANDRVLEVGPGIGTLTQVLLQRAAFVVSIERDVDLIAVLEETCAPWADRFTLLRGDALELSTDKILAAFSAASNASAVDAPAALPASDASDAPIAPSAAGASQAPAAPNKFIANLPYAVAATLVLDYFERLSTLTSATVMVQKEVADRMAAQPGTKNYGAYTVKLSLYAQVAGRFSVGPGNFFPPPHVESSLIRLDRVQVCDPSGQPLDDQTRVAACVMADAAFANRRKTILNSCKAYFSQGQHKDVIAALPSLLSDAGIDAGRRGETLSREDFIVLGQALQERFPDASKRLR